MRTARLLPVSPFMHCSGGLPGPGEVYLIQGGVHIPGGVPGELYLVPGGVVPGPGGVPGPGRCTCRGTCQGTPSL